MGNTEQKYHDYSYKEIAEITGLSESAIDSLLSRAKKNLQQKYYFKKVQMIGSAKVMQRGNLSITN